MSERLQKKIGNELYQKILDLGIKSEDIDLVDEGYIPYARFKEINDKAKAYNEKISLYEKQLNETKSLLASSDEYKNKYSELENKYIADLKAKDNEIINTKKRFLAEDALKKAGAKHTKLLMNQIDLDKISVENESLVGIDTFINEFKNDFSDLFSIKETKSTQSGNGIINAKQNVGDIDWETAVNNLLKQ